MPDSIVLPFLDRSRSALAALKAAVDSFAQDVTATPASGPQREIIRNLTKTFTRMSDKIKRLEASLHLIEHNPDKTMMVFDARLNDEGRQLSRIFQALERLSSPARNQFEDHLVTIDERAQDLATRLFPGAADKLRPVENKVRSLNGKLKKLTSEIEANRSALDASSTDGLTKAMQSTGRIQACINTLALAAMPADQIKAALDAIGAEVDEGLALLSALRVKGLPSKVDRAVRDVITGLHQLKQASAEVRIPLFPAFDKLEEICNCLPQTQYECLAGVQLFALLNIAARLRSIKVGPSHLLDSRYDIKVTRVFPDRIYFTANRQYLTDLQGTGQFEPADSSLHRFREGSFKQKSFPEGNLQICFQSRAGDLVDYEADIDLYRDPVVHLFGEVLVNHLTGSKTSQFLVRHILDSQNVKPLGEFQIHRV